MSTYIALLRGINVSGQKKTKMADLRILFESLGLKDVQSYIQSGNIIFNTRDNITPFELQKTIEDAIQEQYNFFVPVIITTSQYLKQVLQNNPYKDEAAIQPSRVLVTLLQDKPDKEDIAHLSNLKFPPDRFEHWDNAVFMHCPYGSGKSKLSNNLFEKILKVKATTRNYRTFIKILDLMTNK